MFIKSWPQLNLEKKTWVTNKEFVCFLKDFFEYYFQLQGSKFPQQAIGPVQAWMEVTQCHH